MMDALREWLTALIVTTMLLTLVQSLVPEGSIRRAASFTGGVILLAVLLQPFAQWEMEDWHLSDYEQETMEQQEQLEAQGREAMASRIAELTAAYISDKAAALELSGDVFVQTRTGKEGIPLPWSVELQCPYSAELAEWMERELDIPAERQVWYGQEGKN